jgi:serine protease Do
MKGFRSTAAALAVAGTAVGTGFFGFNFVQNTQWARAEQQVQATREQLTKADDLASVFRYVGKVVEPSVVNISVTKKAGPAARGNRGGREIPDQLRRFFPDRDGDGEPDVPDLDEDGGGMMPFQQQGTGSGVIMEAKDGVGFIVTNNHVAGDASSFEITLADGRKITKATLVGGDKKTDLAVIRIEADRLIPAKWGDSNELQKGDWIMAFGSPFGYVGSMTHGIVSALNRNNVGILGRQGYENFIQVDAPINPGNSGGPLVNTRGEVVGINTAIASRTGSFAGIGFAIPSNQVKFVYESLKGSGKVARGWLGVGIIDVSVERKVAKSLGYTGTTGVLVQQIMPNTPSTGKLEEGDIILSIDGKPVQTVQQLRNEVAATKPNTDVKLRVFRERKEQDVTLKLGEQPEVLVAGLPGAGGGGDRAPAKPEAPEAGKLGLRLANPGDPTTSELNLTDIKAGAVVVGVERNSQAAKAGLIRGDVITKIGRQDVKNAAEAQDALNKADGKDGVRLYVTRRDTDGGIVSRFVVVGGEEDQE